MVSLPAASNKRQAAIHGAFGRRVGDAEQVAEYFLSRVMTQPKDGEQQLVGRFEVEGVAASQGALSVGAVESLAALGGKSWEELLQE